MRATATESRYMGRVRAGKIVNCAHCSAPVYRHPSTVGRKYCSWSCRDAAKRAKRVNEGAGTAKCAKCKAWKPIDRFAKASGGRPHSYCKECANKMFEARRRQAGQKPMTPHAVAMANAKEYKRAYNKMATHMRRAAGQFPGKWELGAMLCRQDARCAYCQVLLDKYHVDHKNPVSRGGTNDEGNLHLTCARCNLVKGALTHEEFLVSKKRKAVNWKLNEQKKVA